MPKIIEHMKKTGEWGQFFPREIAVFAYNESAANDYFPLTRDEALSQGFLWKEDHKTNTKAATLTSLPDHINDTPDSITQEILSCNSCTKNYKIIIQELKFYRKMTLPLPRQCPQCRHRERFKLRNPYQLNEQTCSHCKTTILTTHIPNTAKTILCENCMLKEVY